MNIMDYSLIWGFTQMRYNENPGSTHLMETDITGSSLSVQNEQKLCSRGNKAKLSVMGWVNITCVRGTKSWRERERDEVVIGGRRGSCGRMKIEMIGRWRGDTGDQRERVRGWRRARWVREEEQFNVYRENVRLNQENRAAVTERGEWVWTQ